MKVGIEEARLGGRRRGRLGKQRRRSLRRQSQVKVSKDSNVNNSSTLDLAENKGNNMFMPIMKGGRRAGRTKGARSEGRDKTDRWQRRGKRFVGVWLQTSGSGCYC